MESVSPKSLLGRAYEILNPLRGGITTDDNPWNVRMIMRMISSAYPGVLKQYVYQLDRNGEEMDHLLWRNYDNLALVDVPDRKPKYQSERFIIRKVTLPQIIPFRGAPAINYFGGINGDANFMRATSAMHALQIAKGRKWIDAGPAYWFEGTTAYVILPDLYENLKKISVVAVVANPAETLTGKPMDIWFSDFPMADNLWPLVKQAIQATDAQVLMAGEQNRDENNNGNPR